MSYMTCHVGIAALRMNDVGSWGLLIGVLALARRTADI